MGKTLKVKEYDTTYDKYTPEEMQAIKKLPMPPQEIYDRYNKRNGSQASAISVLSDLNGCAKELIKTIIKREEKKESDSKKTKESNTDTKKTKKIQVGEIVINTMLQKLEEVENEIKVIKHNMKTKQEEHEQIVKFLETHIPA